MPFFLMWRKRRNLHTIGGNVNQYFHYENSMEGPQKIKNEIQQNVIQRFHFWVYTGKGNEITISHVHSHVHCIIFHNWQYVINNSFTSSHSWSQVQPKQWWSSKVIDRKKTKIVTIYHSCSVSHMSWQIFYLDFALLDHFAIQQ